MIEGTNEPVVESSVPASDGRDNLIAELEALTEDGEVGNAPEAKAEEDQTNEAEETESTETTEDVEDTPLVDEAKEDIDSQKLAALQRQEKRFKEELAAERAELEKARSEWSSQQAEIKQQLEELKAIKENAKYDPVGTLSKLGLDPESFEDTARSFYSQRPGAENDPKTRAAAQKAFQERRDRDRVSGLESKIEELTGYIQRMEVERDTKEYMGRIERSVSDEAPIMAKFLAADKESFRQAANDTAVRIWKDTGERPDAVDVIRAMENNKRTELEKLGFELPSTTTKKPSEPQQTKAGKTLSNDLGNPTKPRTEPLSERELRADVLRGMQTLE